MDQDTAVNKGVCRCLFGPVNHDEINQTLSQELEKINLQHQTRWNFDFQNERPLEGHYVWKKVGDAPEDEGEGPGKHKQAGDLTVGGCGSTCTDPISTSLSLQDCGLSQSNDGAGLSGTPGADDLRNQQVGRVHDDHHVRAQAGSGRGGGGGGGGGEVVVISAAGGGGAGLDGHPCRQHRADRTVAAYSSTGTEAISSTTTTPGEDVAAAAAATAATRTCTVTSTTFTPVHTSHTPNSHTISTPVQTVASQCGNLKRKPKHITGYMAQKKKTTRRKEVEEPDG